MWRHVEEEEEEEEEEKEEEEKEKEKEEEEKDQKLQIPKNCSNQIQIFWYLRTEPRKFCVFSSSFFIPNKYLQS